MRNCFILILFCCYSISAQTEPVKFSLYFDHDAYKLNPDQLKRIDDIKQLPNKNRYDVHIKGYTNSIGGEFYNLELSRKRAERVKSLLREFTIISVTGYGELESMAADNRRVDVLVHLKVDHVPVKDEIVELPAPENQREPTIRGLLAPKKGDRVILEGIMFYTDQDVIMNESRKALNDLLSFLKQNPNVRFKLIGHICCGDRVNPGLDLVNTRTGKRDLSEARARSLYNYLVKQGIDKKRMRYEGLAYRYPTGKGDHLDRRVEIEITSVD